MTSPVRGIKKWMNGKNSKLAAGLVFLFFLVKGLAWLIVPAALAYWAAS